MIVINSRQGLFGLCLVSVTAGQLAPGPVNDIARVAARATTSAPYVTHSQPSAIMDPSLATNTGACAIAGSLLSSCYLADVTFDADDRRQFATAMWSYTKCACCSAPSSLYQECAWSLKSTSPDRLEDSAIYEDAWRRCYQAQVNCDDAAPMPTMHDVCYSMSNSIHACHKSETLDDDYGVPTAMLSCLCSQSATPGSSLYTDEFKACSNWAKTARPDYFSVLQNYCSPDQGMGGGDAGSTGLATASSATTTDAPSPASAGGSVTPTTSPSGATGGPFDTRRSGLVAVTVMILSGFFL